MRRVFAIVSLLLVGSALAAIDSRDDRAAAQNAGSVALVLPNPDNSMTVTDRIHMAGEYPGLTVIEPPAQTPSKPASGGGLVRVRGVSMDD